MCSCHTCCPLTLFPLACLLWPCFCFCCCRSFTLTGQSSRTIWALFGWSFCCFFRIIWNMIFFLLIRPAVYYAKCMCNCWSILLSFCPSKTPSNHSLKFHKKRFHKGWSIWMADGRQQHKYWDLRVKPSETPQHSSKVVLTFIYFKFKQ